MQAYWIKSVWLSNISKADAGRPVGVAGDSAYTTFIIESWLPPAPGFGPNRTINVYTNAAAVCVSFRVSFSVSISVSAVY